MSIKGYKALMSERKIIFGRISRMKAKMIAEIEKLKEVDKKLLEIEKQ